MTVLSLLSILKSLTQFLTHKEAMLTISAYCLAENSEIQPFLNKSYKLVSSDENFDKVLKNLEIGWIRRKIFELATPKLTLTYNPTTNIYTLSERSLMIKIYVAFQVGEGFNEKTLDGRDVHVLFTLNGTTLRETQEEHDKPTLIIERTFSAQHVLVKVQLKDIISNRVYDAV